MWWSISIAIKEMIFFISSLALMFTVLNGEYGMAFNQKKTGRLDVMLEYCANEYLKLQLDPDGHDVAWYVRQTGKKQGLLFNKYR